MNEQEHHDALYAGEEAERVFSGALFRRVHADTSRFLLEYGTRTPTDRVLSLGCGDGSIERLASGGVGEIQGIDISPIGIERARAAAAAEGLRNVRFEVRDVRAPALQERTFDAVWAIAFLHHLEDASLGDVLSQALRLLAPGGVMVSTDPSAGRAVGMFKRLVARAFDRWHSPDERELDPEDVARRYRSAGFVDVRVLPLDFFIGPLAWIVPGIPRLLVAPLAFIDAVLVRTPGVWRWSSTFAVVARRRAGR